MTGALEAIARAAPALAMIACFACLIGGVRLIVRRRDPRKGALMLVLALVLLVNVWIWQI